MKARETFATIDYKATSVFEGCSNVTWQPPDGRPNIVHRKPKHDK